MTHDNKCALSLNKFPLLRSFSAIGSLKLLKGGGCMSFPGSKSDPQRINFNPAICDSWSFCRRRNIRCCWRKSIRPHPEEIYAFFMIRSLVPAVAILHNRLICFRPISRRSNDECRQLFWFSFYGLRFYLRNRPRNEPQRWPILG